MLHFGTAAGRCAVGLLLGAMVWVRGSVLCSRAMTRCSAVGQLLSAVLWGSRALYCRAAAGCAAGAAPGFVPHDSSFGADACCGASGQQVLCVFPGQHFLVQQHGVVLQGSSRLLYDSCTPGRATA